MTCYFFGRPVSGAVLAFLAVLDVGFGFLGKKQGYVRFSPSAGGVDMPHKPLKADVELAVRAFGCFRVRDAVRYLANHPIIYSTPKSREHIMMAQLDQKRFLLFGVSPEEDWGCWYQFIKPEELDRIEPGLVFHGFRSWVGLLIKHRFENEKGKYETTETILSFDSPSDRSLVWEDLNREFHG
ncbi:MAG: hypothetical protein JXA42_20665 [Anaerolineales bacterium]|nr:hypothetical protein [Anaerolineales bacterium]